jgi:hypothetical protein
VLRWDYVGRAERPPAVPRRHENLLGCVDPGARAQMTFAGDLGDTLRRSRTCSNAALEVYPEPLRADMRRLLTLQEGLFASLERHGEGFDSRPTGCTGATSALEEASGSAGADRGHAARARHEGGWSRSVRPRRW